MVSHYTLLFLALGTVVVCEASSIRFDEPIRFINLQADLEAIGKRTYSTYDALQKEILDRQSSLKKQLNFDIQIEEENYKKKDSQVLEKAKKEGKEENMTGIEICVRYAQAKHGVDLRVAHEKSITCIDQATELATQKLTDYRKTFSQYFDTAVNANTNQRKWVECINNDDEDCVNSQRAKYATKMRLSGRMSRETISSSQTAQKEQYDVTNECVGEVQKEVQKMQNTHSMVMTKCFVKHNLKEKLDYCINEFLRA